MVFPRFLISRLIRLGIKSVNFLRRLLSTRAHTGAMAILSSSIKLAAIVVVINKPAHLIDFLWSLDPVTSVATEE